MAKNKAKKNASQPVAGRAPTSVSQPACSNVRRLRPWLLAAVAALFVACPLLPSETNGRGGEMLPLIMLTLILAVVWTAAQIGRPRFFIRLQATDIAVLALVGFHTISALVAVRYGHARPAINMLWLWIGMGLGYFLLRQLLVTVGEARAVAVVMIGLAVLLAAYGLWQYAYDFPAMRAAYAENPDRMLQDQGLWFPPGSPQREAFDNRLASLEPLATFALTNSLAGYLAPWLVFTVGIFLGAGRQRLRLALAAAAAGLLIAACLILTKSRSGYIAGILGLLLVVFYMRGAAWRRIWKALLIGVLLVALLVAAALAVGGLDLEVLSETGKSLGYRLQYWQSTAAMIAEHPLCGCGPGQFQNAYTRYKLPQASEEIADPHDFLLEVWATAGTPAALAMLAVLICFAWSFVKRNATGNDQSCAIAQCENNRSVSCGERDASAWVLGGGVVGLTIAWPLGLIASVPPDAAVYFLAAPPGIAAAAFLYTWIKTPPQLLEGGAHQSSRKATDSGTTIDADAANDPCADANAPVPGGFAGVSPRARFIDNAKINNGRRSNNFKPCDQDPADRLPCFENAEVYRTLPNICVMAGIGVLVMMVNLSAAGGIGFAGVAGSFWLLLALGLFRASDGQLRELRPPAAMVLTTVLAVLAVACYLSAYQPVLTAESHCQAALSDPVHFERHLLAAAAADPFSAKPWRRLAVKCFADWDRDKKPKDLACFRRYMATALDVDAHSSTAWRMSAERYLKAYAYTKNRDDLEQALSGFRRAVALYENDATVRAQYALALHMAGKEKESQKQRNRAILLDALTPHIQRKIPKSLRQRLIDAGD